MADTFEKDLTYANVVQSDGYIVDYAVCTTYSLNMPTLLSIPFMIGAMSELTETDMKSPHLILGKINQASKKFVVFHNGGCISMPPQAQISKIYSLLEQNVVQITLGKKGQGFVNFHPKVWIIKETNKDTEKSRIKVVVMSRNLTRSTDLDVVCELTANIGKENAEQTIREKHKPLKDFMTWLLAVTPQDNRYVRKQMSEMCGDIDKLETFDLNNSTFGDYEFLPIGIDGYKEEKALNAMLEHTGDVLIVSPFVDPSVLKKFTSHSGSSPKTLITRHSSITEEILSMFNEGVFTVKEVLTDKAEKDVVVDIHEKVYFLHSHKDHLNRLYVGSTNATSNGFCRNVEFLLGLTFTPHKTSYNKFRNELIFDKDECMFEQVYSVPSQAGTQTNTNELLLREAIRAITGAKVSEEEGGAYLVCIQCGKDLPKTLVSIKPLYFPFSQTLEDGVTFRGMKLSMLTEFYVLEVGDGDDTITRIVKVKTLGIPREERDTAIFREIINTPEKFVNYLSFMLADYPEKFLLEYNNFEREHLSDIERRPIEMGVSLYENMVRKACEEPETIQSIRQTMEKVDESVLPEKFMETYGQFEKAIKQIKRL